MSLESRSVLRRADGAAMFAVAVKGPSWSVAKVCAEERARHCVRLLLGAGIHHRIIAQGQRFQIEVPSADLLRARELLNPLAAAPPGLEVPGSIGPRTDVRFLIGLLVGGAAGAVVSALCLPQLGSLLPACASLIGGLAATARARQNRCRRLPNRGIVSNQCEDKVGAEAG